MYINKRNKPQINTLQYQMYSCKKIFTICLLLNVIAINSLLATEKISFNTGWKFIREETPIRIEDVVKPDYNDKAWEEAILPHTANLEPLLVNSQWQGISFYRKKFYLDKKQSHKRVLIELEGAMNLAKVWLNGKLVKEHIGGYLPVVFDFTEQAVFGAENIIVVRLDNTDSEITGPKPLKILDFNMYGGLYRNAWLMFEEPTHITHPILENKTAGGGIFVTYPVVTKQSATVAIQTHIRNQSSVVEKLTVVQEIYKGEKLVNKSNREHFKLEGNTAQTVKQTIKVSKPELWSVDHPNLYKLLTKVYAGKKLIDLEETRIGIRHFAFKENDFYLNGQKTFLRGVNRHQEYPFVGYALSDNAQVRDAIKIKNAGFDYVRLSHYPHSPAFMDACDSLGILALDAILGWQYYNSDEAFRNQMFNASRDLIRRDRNHACVLGWEVSLNETHMPLEFRQKLNAVAHEEYPGDQCFSAGWMPDGYDIYLQARQHRIMHHTSNEKIKKPYIVSEYGDWEYYSKNAGLNQHNMSKETRIKTSSRQLRAYGEKRLLQQAKNLQESHNDNFSTNAFADGYWVMFDYNRGYHDDLEASGIMSIFRLPKFSYYFYKSQRSVSESVKPMLQIGSYWTENSALDVKVFSNCDEVALYQNNKLIEKRKPDADSVSTHLAHPPFTFKLKKYRPSTLKAVGYIKGKEVVEEEVKSPKKDINHLEIEMDESGVAVSDNDVVFFYIRVVDKYGTVKPEYEGEITLKIEGDIELMNVGEIRAEAGIATAVIKVNSLVNGISIKATTADKFHGYYNYGLE